MLVFDRFILFFIHLSDAEMKTLVNTARSLP
ncbi:MAG: hypothetical protein BWX85_01329 [Chloroflexi bacterium ADurb.Bin120]|nr:MAG: hypothetical protein BWX85_01329 [Chloroflexi bacterium ADurb.Bin120]